MKNYAVRNFIYVELVVKCRNRPGLLNFSALSLASCCCNCGYC